MDDAVAQEDLLRLGIEQMRGHQFDLVDQQVRLTNARAAAGHGLTAAVGAGTITAARAVVLVNADDFEPPAETFGGALRHRPLRTLPLRMRGIQCINLADRHDPDMRATARPNNRTRTSGG